MQRIEIVAPIADHGVTGIWRKYWPATVAGTARVVQSFPCSGTSPGANEVFVYDGVNFAGQCAALRVGLYPNAGNMGLPNDAISSLKVGGGARVRLFADGVYNGSQLTKGPGNYSTIDTGWDNVVSSLRVEESWRSLSCNDLLDGEFAVFADANFAGDCVVLRYGQDYATLESIGIANETISSVNAGNGWSGHAACSGSGSLVAKVNLFAAVNLGGSSFTLTPPSTASNLTNNGFNDVTSSIRSYTVCP